MKEDKYIVNVSFKNGPTEIHGGINNTYETFEDAQEVADELICYEYGVSSAWVERVEAVSDITDAHRLLP